MTPNSKRRELTLENPMHVHATKRRRLRTDAVVPGGGDATNGGESSNNTLINYSQLVVVGYTDRGIPLYDKKCLSNDNMRPYSDSCADATAAENENGDENDRDVGGDEGGATDGSTAGAAAYHKYECTSNRYCNTHNPGNNLDLGWTFIGTCRYDSNCPDEYNATNTNSSTYYKIGDEVSVSSDYLNNNIIGSISCPTIEHGSNNSTMLDNSMSMQSQNNGTSIIVPYLYEVETSRVVTADIFLPRLEEQILLNLVDSLMSCLGGDDNAASDVNSKYDIQGIDSIPDDVAINEGRCSITSAEADNCFIINGSITLLLTNALTTVSNRHQRKLVIDSTAVAAATSAAQSYIQTSMEENDLLSPTIPEVIKVKYIHDSYDEYFLGGEASSSTLPQSGSNDGSEDDRGYLDIILGSVFGVLLLLLLLVLCIRRHQRAKTKGKNGLNLMDDASDVHYTGGCGSILMSSLGIMGAAICGILLCKSCKNETKKNVRNDGKNNTSNNGDEHDSPGATEADDGLDDIIDQIDCVTDVNDRRIYVVDPPGAFHLGNHHYTGDGVRYFSPLCEACISARANANGVVTVNAANMADDDSDDDELSSIDRANNVLNNGLSFDLDAATKFTDFNSNDLGRYHSSLHVRTCKSTTCPICIKERGVIFVKARGASAASVGFR